LGGRKGIRPVKNEWWGAGMVICLERDADLHMAQQMPLPLTVSCFSKIPIGFTFLVPAHPGSPGQRAVKRVCVCVLVELRESLSRVGSDLKQRIIESVKSTWRTLNDLARYRRDTGDEAAASDISASDIDNIVSETVSTLDDATSCERFTVQPVLSLHLNFAIFVCRKLAAF